MGGVLLGTVRRCAKRCSPRRRVIRSRRHSVYCLCARYGAFRFAGVAQRGDSRRVAAGDLFRKPHRHKRCAADA
jgi:hypothetical protein